MVFILDATWLPWLRSWLPWLRSFPRDQQGVQFQPAPQQNLSPPPDASGSAPSQPLLLSPAQFLSDPAPLLGVGQLVSVSALGDGPGEGGVHQILLDDGQAIPVQIVEPSGTGEGVRGTTLPKPTRDSVIWQIM